MSSTLESEGKNFHGGLKGPSENFGNWGPKPVSFVVGTGDRREDLDVEGVRLTEKERVRNEYTTTTTTPLIPHNNSPVQVRDLTVEGWDVLH